ncbi:MAG: serine hydrolase domain-containing protein [Pseudomonadota bacterium]
MNSRFLLPTLVLSAALVGCATNRPVSVAGIAEGTVPDCATEQHMPVSDRNPQATQKLTALQSRLPEWLGQSTVPSAGVSYVAGGQLQWTLTCGERSEGNPATADTLYDTASIAKPIVGEIVLRLATQGKVSLDEPMAAFWVDPDIAEDPRRMQLTPRIALAHQTGFRNWRRMSDGVLTFTFDPGTERGYSGEGIVYLTRFLERKLEKPFDDIARETVFDPLGIEDASFVTIAELKSRYAWGRFADSEWDEPGDYDEAEGAGRLRISSADYARILAAVMANDGVDAKRAAERSGIVLDERDERCGPDGRPIEACPQRMGFSTGWYVYEFKEGTVFAHTGRNRSEQSFAFFKPDQGIAAVMFANGEESKGLLGKIARLIEDDERIAIMQGY